jgi:hypothetical protein
MVTVTPAADMRAVGANMRNWAIGMALVGFVSNVSALEAGQCPEPAKPAWLSAPPEPMAKEAPDRMHQVGLAGTVLGAVFFGAGVLIGVGYAATTQAPDRVYAAIPVVGPVVVNSRDAPGVGWTASLVASAWMEAVGIAAIATSAHVLEHHKHLRLRASISPTGGSVGLTGTF